jgi:hypothetical protein
MKKKLKRPLNRLGKLCLLFIASHFVVRPAVWYLSKPSSHAVRTERLMGAVLMMRLCFFLLPWICARIMQMGCSHLYPHVEALGI